MKKKQIKSLLMVAILSAYSCNNVYAKIGRPSGSGNDGDSFPKVPSHTVNTTNSSSTSSEDHSGYKFKEFPQSLERIHAIKAQTLDNVSDIVAKHVSSINGDDVSDIQASSSDFLKNDTVKYTGAAAEIYSDMLNQVVLSLDVIDVTIDNISRFKSDSARAKLITEAVENDINGMDSNIVGSLKMLEKAVGSKEAANKVVAVITGNQTTDSETLGVEYFTKRFANVADNSVSE